TPGGHEGAASRVEPEWPGPRKIVEDQRRHCGARGGLLAPRAAPWRARSDVVVENANPELETGESGTFPQPDIEEGAPGDPHRLEHQRDGARSVNRLRERPGVFHHRTATEDVEHRDRQRHAACGEGAYGEKRLEPPAKEIPAK